MQKIKDKLFQYCVNHVENRIQNLNKNLDMIIDSRNNETKSSVGDKYETGRAMMQMEEEKNRSQLFEAQQTKNELSQLKLQEKSELIAKGNLVKTNRGLYYISVGLGKIELDNQVYFCISYASPIGQLLRNKKKGDSMFFNGNTFEILEVF